MAEYGIKPNAGQEYRLPKPVAVKNKQPSDRQITAEQLLREAHTIQIETEFKAPTQTITDPAELEEYRLTKRKEFEDQVRRMRWNPKVWLKYANWEEQQKDFRRARSVFERAIDVDYRSVQVWLRYAEMEMRNRFVNHARNVWDRAVSLLPRVDQLWYKYVHMEEMLGNVPGARQVFERWLKWEPDHQAWASYINFETRYGEPSRAREIYERYVRVHPDVKSYIKYAKFEVKTGEAARARRVYERAVEELGEEGRTEELFSNFAKFEIMCKEADRARAIYKWALDNLPRSAAENLYAEYTQFERQFGDRQGIEDVVTSKRRFEYEAAVRQSPLSYDAWFDYIRLEEGGGDADRIRDVYERAVANVPPASGKHLWQRYIYLWINYALYEELEQGDLDRAAEVYRTALRLVPHKEFTFAKLWIYAAQLEIRRKNLAGARKLLGQSLGLCPRPKVFRKYIEIEYTMGNVDRCRTLYEKLIEMSPSNCEAWIRFAELEGALGEGDRARALFELAISQPLLDMPELLWKSYIDYEISQGERARARALYNRLLERTKHVKVWLGFAEFEATPLAVLVGGVGGEEDEGEGAGEREAAAREVYSRAYRCLRDDYPEKKEEALLVLEAWRDFERGARAAGADERELHVQEVEAKLPRKVKRKRALLDARGRESGFEEYWDFVFPEEEKAAPNLKLLEAAYKWKMAKKQKTEGEGGEA